jgi:glycosyltransferase involved in cell wall biosynthesis
MSDCPLVSAIVIFLNGETYLKEAIESILAQTYGHWELLLVDDGSTDHSMAIAQQYAQQNPGKVRYLEHEGHQNRGMSATRNLGIANSKGEFIAFLDADDIWLPQKLEIQVAAFNTCPKAGMVVNSTKYWYSWTGNAVDQTRDYLRKIGVPSNECYEPPTLLSRLLRNEVNAPATCSILIRRSLVDQVGGFEESFRGLFEDRAFFSKVYLKIPVFVISECLDWYRQHQNSACYLEQRNGRYNPYKPSQSHFTFLQWLEHYLLQEGIEDREVWQALRISFLPYKNPPLHHLYQVVKRLPGLGGNALRKIVDLINAKL